MADYFERLMGVLSCVYVDKPNRDQYVELMYVLYADTDMTLREVGYALSHFLDVPLSHVMNDVYYSASPEYVPIDSQISELRASFKKSGSEQNFDWATVFQ